MNSNYPERWLNDRRIRNLSDSAHRLFVLALTYSVGNYTDGILSPGDMDDLLRGQKIDAAAVAELEMQEVLEVVRDGWLLVDFDSTQTSAAQAKGAALARKRKNDSQSSKRLTALTAPVFVSEKDDFSLDQASSNTKEALIKATPSETSWAPATVDSWAVALLPGSDGELFQAPEFATTESGVNGAYSK